jgi:hypothetical protein
MDDPLPDDVLVALKAGRRIDAIRLLREARGIGLKEARDRIEAARPRPPRKPRPGPRTPLGFATDSRLRSGPHPAVLAALIAAAAVLWWLLTARR